MLAEGEEVGGVQSYPGALRGKKGVCLGAGAGWGGCLSRIWESSGRGCWWGEWKEQGWTDRKTDRPV